MKKILIFLIVAFTFTSWHIVKADDTIIQNNLDLSPGVNAAGSLKAKTVSLDNQEEHVLIAANNVLSVSNTTYESITMISMIASFDVIEDINDDEVKDIVVSLNQSNAYENILVYSGLTGELLWSKSLAKNIDHDLLVTTKQGIDIYQIKTLNDYSIAIISEYKVIVLDTKTGDILYNYTAVDNIWEIEIIDENTFVIGTQVGQVIALDSRNGKKIWSTQVTGTIDVEIQNKIQKATLNVWDILYHNNQLLVTTEDGKLAILNANNGSMINTIQIQEISHEQLETYFQNYTYTDDLGNKKIIKTGINSVHFMAYRIYSANENQYVITSQLGSEISIAGQKKSLYIEGLDYQITLVDTSSNTITDQITIDDYQLSYSEIVIDQDVNGKDIVILPCKVLKDGIIVIRSYPIDNLKESKDIETPIINPNITRVFLQSFQDGYMLQGQDANTILLSKDLLEVKTNFDTKTNYQLMSTIEKDGFIIGGVSSSSFKSIKKYSDTNETTLMWEIQAKDLELKTDFIRFTQFKDINDDDIMDYVALQNGKDRTHLLFIDGKTGEIVIDAVSINPFDSRNPYLYVEYSGVLSLIKDMNQDGIEEIVIDDYILDGKTYQVLGKVILPEDVRVDTKLGDVNQDGFPDFLPLFISMESNNSHSGATGGDLTQRPNYVLSYYQSKIQCQNRQGNQYCIVTYEENNVYDKIISDPKYTIDLLSKIGDIDEDGIEDIVFTINENLNQHLGLSYINYKTTYEIRSGKDFSLINVLGEEGSLYGNIYSVLDFDIDEDGYHDLLVKVNDAYGHILSTKTGELLAIVQVGDNQTKELPDKNEITIEDYAKFNFFGLGDFSRRVIQLTDKDDENKKYIMVYVNSLNEFGQDEGYLYFFNQDLSGEPFKKVKLALPSYYEDSTKASINIFSDIAIKKIPGSDTKYLINGLNYSMIYDIEEEKHHVSFNLPVVDIIAVDDNRLIVTTKNGNIHKIDYNVAFDIMNLKDKQSISNHYVVKWNLPIATSNLYSVYNNQKIIAKTTMNQETLYLPTGENELLFIARTQDGILYSTYINVDVKKPWFSTILYTALSVISMAVLIFLSRLPKIRKKRGIRGDKHE